MKIISFPFGTVSLLDNKEYSSEYALLLHYKRELKDYKKFIYDNYIRDVIEEIICDECNKNLSVSSIISVSYSKGICKIMGVDNKNMCSKSCVSSYTNRKRIKENPEIHINMIRGSVKKCKGLSMEDKVGIDRATEIKKYYSELYSKDNPAWSKKYRTDAEIKKQKEIAAKTCIARCLGKTYEEQYGEDKGKKIRKLLSELNSGEKNNMYGKPPGKNAGRGICGRYKNMYFRSLLEFRAMIFFESNNIKFESAEKFSIEYYLDGRKKTYRPDFYLSELNKLIEVKPLWNVNSRETLLKIEAAKKIYDIDILTENDIPVVSKIAYMKLIDDKSLEFNEAQKKRADKHFL